MFNPHRFHSKQCFGEVLRKPPKMGHYGQHVRAKFWLSQNAQNHQTRTVQYGSRSFTVSGSTYWNSPPQSLSQCLKSSQVKSSSQFCYRLKTVLFELAYAWVHLSLFFIRLCRHKSCILYHITSPWLHTFWYFNMCLPVLIYAAYHQIYPQESKNLRQCFQPFL